MDKEIGVATDRGSEVRVELERKAEVPDVLRSVYCLRHGAQRRNLDEVFLGLSGDLGEQLVDGGAFHPAIRALEVISHDLEELRETLYAVRVRQVMRTVDDGALDVRGLRRFREVLGDRFVREQHEILDKQVGSAALLEHDIGRLPVLIDEHFYFWGIKGDGALRYAACAYLVGKHLQGIELRKEDTVLGIKYFLRLLVRKALVRVDDGLAEPAVHYARIAIELEDGRYREPILVRVQRAEVVRQDVREHGNGSVDEVDRGRAGAALRVYRRTRAYEIRDVRDVHADFGVAVFKRAHGKRIIEVLRIERVDGEGRDAAEIMAAFRLALGLGKRFRRLRRDGRLPGPLELLRFLHHAGREVAAEPLRQGEGAHLGLVLSGRPDYFLERAPRIRLVARPSLEADEHLVVERERLALHHERHVHLLPIGREHDEILVLVPVQRSHERRAVALYDIHHFADDALLAGSGVELRSNRLYPDDIAGERAAEVLCRDIEVGLLGVSREESFSGTRDDYRSFVCLFRLGHLLRL